MTLPATFTGLTHHLRGTAEKPVTGERIFQFFVAGTHPVSRRCILAARGFTPSRSGPPPMQPPPPDVTQLLLAWSAGDQAALDRLMPLVYEELRRQARRHLQRERRDHSLQTTALVNEAYLRMVDLDRVRFENRAHFFAISARLLRQILVDLARRRATQKRGGG